MKLLKSTYKILKEIFTALFNLVFDPENEAEISDETEKCVVIVSLVIIIVEVVIALLVFIFIPF